MFKIRKKTKDTKTAKDQPVEETNNKSDHNLLLLGITATGIALITTTIILILYHNTGDIYLDRSRPGFLPDEEEVQQQEPASSYSFPASGVLTESNLEEYVTHFGEEVDRIDDLDSPFSATPLSNDALGIPADPVPEPEPEQPAEPDFFGF